MNDVLFFDPGPSRTWLYASSLKPDWGQRHTKFSKRCLSDKVLDYKSHIFLLGKASHINFFAEDLVNKDLLTPILYLSVYYIRKWLFG